MLRKGYWLTEYLSISRVIAKSKKSYEKAFLYAEADQMDIGYFVAYNLRVLEQSFQQLQNYIKRKQSEKNDALILMQIGDINERQAQIIKHFDSSPNAMLTIKDIQTKFMISPTTAKADVTGLVKRGILAEIALNKIKRGYIKGGNFNDALSKH